MFCAAYFQHLKTHLHIGRPDRMHASTSARAQWPADHVEQIVDSTGEMDRDKGQPDRVNTSGVRRVMPRETVPAIP